MSRAAFHRPVTENGEAAHRTADGETSSRVGTSRDGRANMGIIMRVVECEVNNYAEFLFIFHCDLHLLNFFPYFLHVLIGFLENGNLLYRIIFWLHTFVICFCCFFSIFIRFPSRGDFHTN